jgi:hypothetical protein
MRLIGVYYRHGGGQRVILFLYVDGILIFGTSFDMKDMCETDVILNIKLIKEENMITLM